MELRRRRTSGGVEELVHIDDSGGQKARDINEPLQLLIDESTDHHQKQNYRSASSTLNSRINLIDFVWNELIRGYSLQNDQSRFCEKRRKVYTFIKIPIELEKFLFYGFLQCIDSFCYFFTFLPIRFVMAVVQIVRMKSSTASETCDLLRVIIVVTSTLLMQFIDTSTVYHLIRGQSVIKLYIFYNMLDVADKLFSSFGQDVLDALFWTATEPLPTTRSGLSRFRTVCHLVFAIVYALMHTGLVLLQAITLNVAFNSHNKALLTIMMSNNFVELKGSVFKKFAKPNLFQMACSDVRERFHYVILLSIVVMRNMKGLNWSMEHFVDMIPDIALVIIGEFIIDWLKHAFITKFNEIPAAVYRDFTTTIAYDVVKSRDENAFSDYSDQVSRRMGFIPIPLSILVIRVFTQTFSFDTKVGLILLGLVWMSLMSIKILNGIVLLGMACKYVQEYKDVQAKAEFELYLKRISLKKSKSVPTSPRMSLIDFSDVMQQTARTSGYQGFTLSDLMAHLDELSFQSSFGDKSSTAITSVPRRSQSMITIDRMRRDVSEPPPALSAVDERLEERESVESSVEPKPPIDMSPKRRLKMPSECESLADVQAYTLLLNSNDHIAP